jgi:thiol-disulfide isomerase/thioredoxin
VNSLRLVTFAVGVVFFAALVYALRNEGASIGQQSNNLATGSASESALPVGPMAPDFAGITGWLNSAPLSLTALAGKVVLVDFWTYSCINCQRTLPELRGWWDAYHDKGLIIVGVHSPEFDFEKDPANVQRAVTELGVTWPVALDPAMATWNAYQNQYWPAEYLIDQRGRIRHVHFGEGDYDVTERAIETLLGVAGPGANATAQLPGAGITAEAYAGAARSDGRISLLGSWSDAAEFALSGASGAAAQINFTATDVYLVAGAVGAPVTAQVTIDGRTPTSSEVGSAISFDGSGRAVVMVGAHDLYPLLSLPAQGSHRLTITFDGQIQLFTFTFG